MKPDYFGYENNFKKYENIKSNLIIEGKVKNPKITIAIPTYRRVELLKEALLSAINQKEYSNYNIIVIDNDDSENRDVEKMILALNSEKISYYKNEKNIGMFGNWNRCIELADGEYFSLLNDDDWLEKNFLFELSKYLDKYDGIYCEVKLQDYRKEKNLIKENKLKKELKKINNYLKEIKKVKKVILEDFIYNNLHNSFILKRKRLLEIGGYNEKFFPISDYVVSVKFCYKNNIVMLKKRLYNYRIQTNESLNVKTARLFPKTSLRLRSAIVNKLEKKSNFYKKIIYIQYLNEKKYIKEFWKLDIDFRYRYIKKDEKILNFYKRIRSIIKNIFI